jgi:hypothetical protein
MMSRTLLIVALAGTAFAQAQANKNTTPKGLPPAPKPVAQSPAPASTAKPTLPATQPTMKPSKAASKKTAKPGAVVKHSAKMAAPAAKPAETGAPDAAKDANKDASADKAPEIKRGRDPFVSVVMARESGVSCSGAGKKCLIIDQVMLKGIVRSQVGPIAVVTSSSNKTYFLRENDPVYNGVVVKINPDSIVFRETVTDRLGKSIQREVVKKVNNSAV